MDHGRDGEADDLADMALALGDAAFAGAHEPRDPASWRSPFYDLDDPDDAPDSRRPRPPRRASDRVWEQVREDYLAGETAAEVCRRWGLKVATLRARAAAEGWRRADVPEADPEPLPREPEPDLDALMDPTGDDPADYAALSRRALARFDRALSRGRAAEAATWLRLHARLRALARTETEAPQIDSIDSIDPVFSPPAHMARTRAQPRPSSSERPRRER